MFTRAQINQLQELSQQVFQNEQHWKKLHVDPRLQVFDHYVEVPDIHDYVPVAKKGNKIKYKCVRKALAEGEKAPIIQKPVFRPMTFEELSTALLAALEMQQFAGAYKKDDDSSLYELVVRKYRDGTIINKAFLTVSEDEKADFDSLFELLPEDQKTVLKSYVVPNQNPQIFSVNGVKFVTELVYQNKHVEGENEAK